MSNENTNGTGRKPRLIIHPEDEETFVKQRPQPNKSVPHQGNRSGQYQNPQGNQSGQSQAYQHTQSTAAKSGQKPRLIIHPENEQNPQTHRSAQYQKPQANRSAQYQNPQANRSAQYQNPQANRSAQYQNPQANRSTQYQNPQANRSAQYQKPQANQNVQPEANGTGSQKKSGNSGLLIGLAVLALLIGAVVWYSSSSGSIVGTWGVKGEPGTITFEKNGHGYMSAEGMEEQLFDFTYEAKDGKLTMQLNVGNAEKVACLYELKENKLNIKQIETGEVIVFEKVS